MAHRHLPQFSPMPVGPAKPGENEGASVLFDQFCAANTFQGIMTAFHGICDAVEERPVPHQVFYKQLKPKLNSWKAQSLWTKLDKRAAHKEYKKGAECTNTCALIIGGGPCGLRTAIEIALLGGKAVVIEKRDRFSRNNVLHLWPFLIHDLKALGAKKFFGKFCAGSIDHVSIRTLQCILLKTALLVGVEVHAGVSYDGLIEPAVKGDGWKAKISPSDHPVSQYEFDVLIGADGKRNTLAGFRRKEFRGKLAIAITANFINRNTQAEASVEEISGVAFIFNQKFFKDLNHQTGIDLENIVYYKDETHYFVMTAKKHSLLDKHVLKQDYESTERLLHPDNVNQKNLEDYAKQAADFSTKLQLPSLDFAHNQYGQPDVSMFDFTSIYAAEHASRVTERKGSKLLVGLVGDSLLEPFWPTGSGCARGFFGAFDTCWMIRSWASGKKTPLEVMAERESVYQLLSQTTPENISKNCHTYTMNPNSRYPNLHSHFFQPHQMKNQYDGEDMAYLNEIVQISVQKSSQYEWMKDSHHLLRWFQRQLEPYRNVIRVLDLTKSWRNGIALCCLIHRYRPHLMGVDIHSLDPNNVLQNNQLAFDIAEKEFGIEPVLTAQDLADTEVPDKMSMVAYLSRFFTLFRKESIEPDVSKQKLENKEQRAKQHARMIKRVRHNREEMQYKEDKEKKYEREGANVRRRRKPLYVYGVTKRRVKDLSGETQDQSEPRRRFHKDSDLAAYQSGSGKVTDLAKGLAIKFSGKEDPNLPASHKPKGFVVGLSHQAEMCYFCKEPVYLMERYTAEGLYFHQSCFQCHYCGVNLKLATYSMERHREGVARFFCPQHHGMKTKHRRPPRRQAEKPALASKFEPPSDRPNERIEYVTESEVEESEMDQTTHNLSSSMLNLNDEIDSDSSTDDDADGNYDGNLSEGETSWALMASANKAVRKVGKARRQWSSDSDTETETAGASDADYETETETEKEDEPERMPRKKPTDFGQSHLKPPQPPLPKEIKPSPTSIESMKSRMSFFDIPTEPVRIDPFAFFGMKKTPAPSVDAGPEDKNDEDETVADSKDDTDNTTEGGAAEEATAKVAKSSSKRKHHVVGDVSVEMAAEMHDTVSLVDLDNESSTEDEDEEEVEYFTDSDEFMAGVGPDQEVASFESASSDEFYGEDGDVIEDSSTQSKISESEETSDSVIPDLGQRSSGCTPDADEILADDISDNVEESDLTKSVPADDKPDSEEKLPTPLTISMPDQQDIVTHGKSEQVPPTDTMQTEEAVATKSEPLPPTNTELLSPVSREMTPESTTATSPSPVTSPSVTSPDSTPGWPAAPRSKRSIVRKRTLPGQVISTKIQAIREPAKIYPPRPVIPPVVPTNLDDIPLIDDAEEICTVEMDAPEIKWVSTTVIQDENVVQSGPPEISKSPTPDRQLEVSEAIDAEKTSEPPLVDEDAEHLQPGDEDMDKESIDTGDMLSDNYSRDATPGFDELDDLMKENEFKELATPSSPAPVCLEEALVIEELIADAIADEDQRMSPELQESMPSDVEGDSVEVNTKDNNEHVEPIVEVDMDSQPVVSEFETVEIEGESSQNGEKSQSDDMIQVESCDDRGRLDVCQNQPQEADGSTGSSPEINNEAAHEEGDTESMNAIENSESDVSSEIATRLSPELKVEGVEAVVSEYVPPEETFQDRMAPPVVDDSIETSNSEVSETGICKQEGTPDQDGSVLDESYTTCPGSLQTSRRDSGGDGSTPAEQEGDSHLQELIENLADNIVSAVVQEAIEEAQKMQEIIITSPEDDEYVTESQDNDGGLDLRLKSSSSGSSSSHDPGHLIYGSSDTGTSPGLSPQGVKTPPKATIDEFDDLDSMSNATSLSSVRRDSADVMNLDSDAERKDSKLNSPTEEPGVVHDESQGDSFTTCPGSLHSSIDISREDNMTNSVIQTADHPPQPAVTVTEEPVSEEVVVPDTLVMPESPSAASGSIRALGSSPEVTTPLGSDLMEETDTTATVSTEDTLTTGAPVEYATGDSLDDSEGEVPSPIKDDCEQAATIDGEIEIEKAIVHESEEKHEPDVTEESDVNVTDEIKETVSETVDELMPEYTSEIDTIQNKSEPEEPKEPKEEKMPFENKHGDVVTKQDDEAVPDKAEDCISDIESGKENIAEKASELLLRRPRSAQDKEKSLLRRLDKLVIGERDSSVRMSLPNMDEKYGHILKEHRAKVRLSAGVAEELNGSHSVSAENLKFLYAKDGTPEPVKATDLKEETPKTIEKEAPDDKDEQPKEEKKDTPEPEPERKLSEKRRTVLRARVSARDVISAKRKFFCEPPRPVQIDPKSIFSQIPMAHRKQEPSTKFGWSQSMDTPVSVSPTTAMPRSNSASGDADFTLITSQLPKPEKGATKDAVAVNGVSEKAELSVDVAGHPSDSSSISPNPSVSLSSDTASNPSPAVLRREAESSERSSSQSTAEASDSPKTATLERKQEEHHKRKSFLAKILPSKRRDKVEKSEVKAEKKARSEEKSKKRKKASESKRAEKERANIPVGYILREVGPMGAHLKRQRHHRGRGKQPSIQERIEAVAPAPGLYRRETPPRATIDEMDNESDTVSLSSSKTATEKELLRERRKQKQLLERQRKAEERKRLRKAQEIQRLLEEVGQKQKIVEQRGVTIEKKLRQNASHGVPEEGQQMEQWFNLVHEKNVLARYESELMIRARELELQDRHSRLERRLRESAADTTHRSEDEEAEEQRILKELVEIVEQRDALVRLLEEDRVRERDVDDELKQVMNRIGYELSPILYLKSLSLSSVNIDPNELLE